MIFESFENKFFKLFTIIISSQEILFHLRVIFLEGF